MFNLKASVISKYSIYINLYAYHFEGTESHEESNKHNCQLDKRISFVKMNPIKINEIDDRLIFV